MLEDNKVEAKEEGAPAVVGTLKVSNDLLDFSSLGKKKKVVKCDNKGECTLSEESDLTPRERAILARKKKSNE